MPKVGESKREIATLRSQIATWIESQPVLPSRPGNYDTWMYNEHGLEEYVVRGIKYGKWFGLWKESDEYIITHLPTALCFEFFFASKKTAEQWMFAVHNLVDWDFNDFKEFESAGLCDLMARFCEDSISTAKELRTLAGFIQSGKLSRESSGPKKPAGILPAVEVGEELPSVDW